MLCPACQGRGTVIFGRVRAKCKSCDGTGDKPEPVAHHSHEFDSARDAAEHHERRKERRSGTFNPFKGLFDDDGLD